MSMTQQIVQLFHHMLLREVEEQLDKYQGENIIGLVAGIAEITGDDEKYVWNVFGIEFGIGKETCEKFASE